MSPRKNPGPPCVVCGKSSIAKGLCETHYRRMKRHGHLEQTRPADWGQKSKHPLWQSWKWMNRTGNINSWSDFWTFVSEVGDRPHDRSLLKRRDETRPFGPENWYWSEPLEESAYIKEDKARRNAYMKAWRERNPLKAKEHDLKKLFGITLAEYHDILVEQGGKCAICKQKDHVFSLAVDHCHGTKRVRGLLCHLCNRGIGMFKDNPDLLEEAARYLRHPKRLI